MTDLDKPKTTDADLDKPIWGAKRIGVEANVNERKANYLIKIGVIDATKAGNLYVSTPRRVRRSLGIL